jgi:uncharacterized protein YdeI (YjbR/CyaY-like superfamily)
MKDNLPILLFETQTNWESWLEKNINETGVWLKIAKKESGQNSVSYQQAVDSGICFGWIDGQKQKFDEQFYLQRFTPRKTNSNWSKINKEKALKFIAEGKMKDSGLLTIENAKKSGAWENAYESQKNIQIPDDFQTALNANSEALHFFNSLNSVNRFAILVRIKTTKSAEKRAEKIEKFLEMLVKKEKIYS